MKRKLQDFTNNEYDLLIIGGGIYGCAAAWEAASRGLTVALVEKGDFACATSANHFKMVHGGIRYLQHLDIKRVRKSSRERSALLRIAPHLVQPLPIVIPTYGHGKKGKGFFRLGFLVYDLLTLDRNNRICDRKRCIPPGAFLSREQVLDMAPYVNEKGLTGGAVFCDAQVYNPPRLALSFLKSAVSRGAVVANYVEVGKLLWEEDKVCGALAKDVLNGDQFAIRARVIHNTAGPWANRLLQEHNSLKLRPAPTFSRDLAFVANQKIPHDYAFANPIKSKDKDTVLDRGGRHLFVVPWRDRTLVGVWHKVYKEHPDRLFVTRDEIRAYLREVKEAFPGLDLSMEEVRLINTGLTLFGEEGKQNTNEISFGKRSLFVDHEKRNGIKGIITVIGVRATMARGLAKKAIDSVMKKLGKSPGKSQTQLTPIWGGDTPPWDEFVSMVVDDLRATHIPENIADSLSRNYGSHYLDILKFGKSNSSLLSPIGKSTTLKAEVINAVREEMAQRLGDVVFRRTELGTAGFPGQRELEEAAELMAKECGWDDTRVKSELDQIKAYFKKLGFLSD